MIEADRVLFFPTRDQARSRWRFGFFLSITFLFCVANSPPARLVALVQFGSEAAWATAKSTVFLIALLIVLLPMARDLGSYAARNRRELVYSLVLGALIFGALCLLIFPVSIDRHGHVEIARGLARCYADMSSHPFSEDSEYFYRRLLLPAFAYYLQLRGNPWYEIFALACAFLMVVAVVHFLRVRTAGELMPAGHLHRGFMTALAVATCGFVIVGVQWPGYPEQLGFLFLLLPAFIPMCSASRLTCVTFALLAHDGMVFPLVPIILFCFPKGEKRRALSLIALYLLIFAVSYGFRLSSALALHDTFGPESYFHDLFDYPLVVLFGIFSAFKFYWSVFFIALFVLIKQRRYRLFWALSALMFSFVPMLFLAWDVTRLVNFSFLAVLMSVVIVWREAARAGRLRAGILPLVAAASLAMPSYNVALWWLHHGEPDQNGRTGVLREPGAYQWVSRCLPFTLPAAKRSD